VWDGAAPRGGSIYDAAAPSPEAVAPADGSLLKDVMNSVRLATGGGERDRSRRLRHSGTHRRNVYLDCVGDRVASEKSDQKTARKQVCALGRGNGPIAGICASMFCKQQALVQSQHGFVAHTA